MKKNDRDDFYPKGRKEKMLKELVRNNSPQVYKERISPVDEALMEFEKENGYKFLDMTNDPKIRAKHRLKQLQIKKYDDNDFLEKFQDYQGD